MSGLSRKTRYQTGSRLPGQRGVVVPIVAIGLLALLAVAGLALDGSHAIANKTRMQNTVDAAALAAAKLLDLTEDTAQATAAANSIFSTNANGAGNHELNDAYDNGDISVTVQFSATLNPFSPGSYVAGSDSWFVRVIAGGFDTQTTLSKVLGVDEIPTPATAVAGPSGPLGSGPGSEVCDLAPIAVCPPDGGFQLDELEVLKPVGGNHDEIGPGNYKMLRLGCNGDNCLRQNLAGDFNGCATHSDTVETEPGVGAGPTSQGFNTRFNKYQGGGLNSNDYPPDRVVAEQDPFKLQACLDETQSPALDRIYKTDGKGRNYCNKYDPEAEPWSIEEVEYGANVPYNYADYAADPGPYLPNGVKNRRLLIFPTIDCDGSQNGQSTLAVTGFACFFMLQALDTGNIGQGGGQIFGQYVGTCDVNGTGSATPDPGPGPLLYKIQLYKDPDSGDS